MTYENTIVSINLLYKTLFPHIQGGESRTNELRKRSGIPTTTSLNRNIPPT